MGTQIIKWSGYFWGAGRKKLASVNQKWIAPKTCASKLKSWQTKKTPLNLVVSEAGINEDVTIKSFEYKPFGGHGDYSYEISFVPYVEMKIYTTDSPHQVHWSQQFTTTSFLRTTGAKDCCLLDRLS